jgi:hypothetical protein
VSSVGIDALLVVGASLAAFGASVVTNRRARKTDDKSIAIEAGKLELDERRADGEAYDRAAKFNTEITDQLSAQLHLMSATLDQMRADLVAERQKSARLATDLLAEQRQSATHLAHIAALEARIAEMQALLGEAAPAPEDLS